MYLHAERNGDVLEVELSGRWLGAELPAIDAELAGFSLAGARSMRLQVPGSVTMDLAGAWRLREWLKAADEAGVSHEFAGQEPGQLALIDATLAGVPHTPGTREYLTCESGELELAAAGRRWRLQPGDVVVFRGDQNHGYRNLSRRRSVAYSVIAIAG